MKTKAAEARHLVPVVLNILRVFFPPKTDHEILRCQCLEALSSMYDELEHWGPDSGRKVAQLGRRHVMLYAELSLEVFKSMRPNEIWLFWKMYPKQHQLIHCLEEQLAFCENPRDHWCYADESAIGLSVKTAESCKPRNLHRAVIGKYRL